MHEIHLVVDLREDKIVQALQSEAESLRAQVEELQTQVQRAEFNLMFEYHVNEQLADLCREHGILIPRKLFSRTSLASNGS